ncbi:alanine/glycine:cation symporter family protein [Anaerotignum sp.]|uniref:alanine/glycine:cation symporter family protein n=1 Tax=Anaerotignum sp. TaxID=2039241 RepID=UPI0028AA38F3|nr:sodium:alanine symporter family protein [Anaerotignum sp.]
MVDALNNFFGQISGILWGNLYMYVLVGTGIFFTVGLKFPQIRRLKDSFRLTFAGFKKKEKAGKDGMTAWQSLTTAIAGQVGTGNIAGPATAIMAGGPGAIFWMWVSAFFGMGTIFAEATAAQKYKEVLPDGTVVGGPSHYIRAAFKGKLGSGLATAFAIFLIIGFGIAAAMIQGNTISDAFAYSFGVPKLAIGVGLAILTLIVVSGGVKRIVGFITSCVPAMALLYIVAGLIVIFANADQIIPAFKMIFIGAFNPKAVAGGMFGVGVKEAMRYGIARGLFSNEAGTGSTPHAHAVAKVKHPCDQGLVAFMSVFIDTFIILNITTLVILTSGSFASGGEGITLTQVAFEGVFGTAGSLIISVCIFFFSFSTIIAAYFYGEQNVIKLFGKKAVPAYTAIIALFVIIGSGFTVSLVWSICDVFNGFMVFVNILGLWGVSAVIFKLWKEYEHDKNLDTTLNDILNDKKENVDISL